MMGSLYIGATGMKSLGTGLNTVGNNLANVNTVGYKQQSVLFSDLISQDLPIGSTSEQGFNQLGMGVQVGAVRTLFTQGAFEPGNAVSDLSIGGKGFFQVTQDDKQHYTRAGNFRFNTDGWLNDPSGFTLSGVPIVNGQKTGALEPIHLDTLSAGVAKSPAKITSEITAGLNLGDNTSKSSDPENPYFSLLNKWDATSKPPLPTSAYSYNQPVTMYDSEGIPHEVNVYFDGAPSTGGGEKVFEYVVAMNPPTDDGSSAAGTPGAGLLMSGTLKFSSSGELVDMTGFTPNGGNNKDLTTWTPAPLSNGLPQFNMQYAGQPAQPVTLNFGVKSKGTEWANAPGNAALVGVDTALLPTMGGIDRNATSSTAFVGGSNLQTLKQDGKSPGDLMDLAITEDGTIRGVYSNNETVDFYSIPVFRFTSEDGLHREGMNHYTAGEEVGLTEYGTAGTSNYGKIISNQLEISNVDMSREMVNLIMVQRGFQMNSKTVTTADTMLQKALELKRN